MSWRDIQMPKILISLYGWCCAMVKPDVMNLPFKEVMWRHKELELPSFDTIQRTRQKLQHDHPELVEQYMEEKTEIKKGKKEYVRITSPKEDKS